MSWSYPSTVDAPTFLAIAPDWAAGIAQNTTYRTDINRSRRGLEQRAQRLRKPSLTMEYQWTANDAAARRRIENAVAQARGVLYVPWWPHGIPTQAAMTTDAQVFLDGVPISGEMAPEDWVYIWHRETGGEFRQITSRVDLALNLVSLPELEYIVFPAGAFVFPVKAATRETSDSITAIARTRTVDETLTFRTL